jgi:hypothetical protein
VVDVLMTWWWPYGSGVPPRGLGAGMWCAGRPPTGLGGEPCGGLSGGVDCWPPRYEFICW